MSVQSSKHAAKVAQHERLLVQTVDKSSYGLLIIRFWWCWYLGCRKMDRKNHLIG